MNRFHCSVGVKRWYSRNGRQFLVFMIGFVAALAAAVVANGGVEGARLPTDQQVLFRIGLQTLFLGLAITFRRLGRR